MTFFNPLKSGADQIASSKVYQIMGFFNPLKSGADQMQRFRKRIIR